jgi:type II secretory pathway pseudopilin PulG
MNRPACSSGGFTLIEVLVATALTLMLMAAVVTMFGSVGDSVEASRAVLEMADRQRAAATRLQRDLEGVTATMMPPLRPEAGPGYFKIAEGPIGPDVHPSQVAVKPDPDNPGSYLPDTTVADFDDILMFTTRTSGRPFSGRLAGGVVQSDVAEVAWFVRGRTLYRRMLLVVGGLDLSGMDPGGFWAHNDISVRLEGGRLVANTLADLTKPECRYAHDTRNGPGSFPFDVRGWGQLGLPTLRECSDSKWMAGSTAALPQQAPYASRFDLWSNVPAEVHPWTNVVNPQTGVLSNFQNGTRLVEDVILTNVIGFDVKVWDMQAGRYVDLGYARASYEAYRQGQTTGFGHMGHPRSGLAASQGQARVYDTWSFHYEHDGIRQPTAAVPGVIDAGTNGFDDNGNGIVDDPDERETMPPYPIPLRGIQVKIRAFEPDSRQVREVTVVQDFLPRS